MLKTLMCEPSLLGTDLSGRTYIVTGANSGAGLETARQLVKQGAHVVGGCRRVDAGESEFATFADLPGTWEIMRLDLTTQESVREFAATFTAKHERLDALVNNAGAVLNEGVSPDGIEATLAVNYLSPFLLTHLLLDVLRQSAPSRVINVSSVAHAGMRGVGAAGAATPTLDFDDLDFRRRDFDSTQAYSEAKLAVVMFSAELARRLEGTGVTVYSVHPGWIQSNFGSAVLPGWVRTAMKYGLYPFRRPLGVQNTWEGAQTQLHCVLADDAPEHNGDYYSQNSMLYPKPENRPGGWPMRSPNPMAHDAHASRRLYEVSCALVGASSVGDPEA